MARISRLAICPFNGLRWANSQSKSPKGLGSPIELSFEMSLLFRKYAMDTTLSLLYLPFVSFWLSFNIISIY